MVWPVKTHPAHSTGLESKKISSGGEGFSLDFPFYRTDITGDSAKLPDSRQTSNNAQKRCSSLSQD